MIALLVGFKVSLMLTDKSKGTIHEPPKDHLALKTQKGLNTMISAEALL